MSSEERMKRQARQTQMGSLSRQRGIGGKLKPLPPIEVIRAPSFVRGLGPYLVQEPNQAQVYAVSTDGSELHSEPPLPPRLLLAVRTRLGLHG